MTFQKTALPVLCLALALFFSACEKKAQDPSLPGENAVVSGTETVEEDPSLYITVSDKRYTATSLIAWELFNYDGNFSDNCLQFLRRFIENDSEYPEFNTVSVTDWEIIRDPEVYDINELAFNFTVTASELDALPVGVYETVVCDSVDCMMQFVTSPRKETAERFTEDPAALALADWFRYAQYYDFCNFGAWENERYARYLNYRYRDETGRQLYSTFTVLAKDLFGDEPDVENYRHNGILYVEDNSLYLSIEGLDQNTAFDILDVTRQGGIATVTVQHYGDCNKFLLSYVMSYRIDDNGRFLDCKILTQAPYKPYELRSVYAN